MTNMLADVINAGTGPARAASGFTLPAAGKTGTTNDYNDAWFVGFTPKLVAGVWVGFDQPRTILPNGYAGDVAVPLWAKFMKAATTGDKPEWFKRPGRTSRPRRVCRLSGKLATEGCEDVEVVDKDGKLERRSMVYTEYFVRGTEPTEYCDLHPTRGIWASSPALFTGDGEAACRRASRTPASPTGSRPRPAAPAAARRRPSTARDAAGAAEEEARLLVAGSSAGAKRRRTQGRERKDGVRAQEEAEAEPVRCVTEVIRSVPKALHAVSRRRRPRRLIELLSRVGRARHAAAEPVCSPARPASASA